MLMAKSWKILVPRCMKVFSYLPQLIDKMTRSVALAALMKAVYEV